MQHKLNCIASLHTPISPVSHGHRAQYYRTAVFAWPCVGGIQQHATYKRTQRCTVRVQKLALREGYASAGRAIPRRVSSPAVPQKYHPPEYLSLSLSLWLSLALFLSLSLSLFLSISLFLSLCSLLRDYAVIPAAASLSYLHVAPPLTAPTLHLITFSVHFFLSSRSFFSPVLSEWARVSTDDRCADRVFLNYARFMPGGSDLRFGTERQRLDDTIGAAIVKGGSRLL